MRKRYKIPLGTKVEIISGCSDNGRIGTLGAKETGGLDAHNVYFSKAEFDFNTFMDDEVVPVQNMSTKCDLYIEGTINTENMIVVYVRFKEGIFAKDIIPKFMMEKFEEE